MPRNEYRELVDLVTSDPRYQRNVEFGEPRPGHPEGKVRRHIADLEGNLERLKTRLPKPDYYWKLLFLIHVHDAFKAESGRDVPILHPRSHASLARAFASRLTDDADLLNMLQFHDEGYALWKQLKSRGSYNQHAFEILLTTIDDWDLFLLFNILDGCTPGKERSKLTWFIKEVRKFKTTLIDESWIL
jgi:hypothetical protein